MAFTLVHQFPTLTLTAGVQGTPPAVDVTSASYPLTYILEVVQADGAAGGWVHDGSDAVRVDGLDVSYDGGVSWTPLIVNEMIQDVAVAAVVKNSVTIWPADTFVIAASLGPQVGGTQRQLRFRYTPIKSVHVTPAVYSNP